MYRDPLGDATFHELLLAYDRDLADTARRAGCARCSGVVHSAPYWRKPRGLPCRLGSEHDRRFSFCCAVDGCRSPRVGHQLLAVRGGTQYDDRVEILLVQGLDHR